MRRRSFLKTLIAAAGVAFVPSIGIAVHEPKWMVENVDGGFSFGVGADWGNRRHAVVMMGHKQSPEKIEYCKQALRQWYLEKSSGV